MRDTRVIYVENDAALRGFISRSLTSSAGIDVVLETGSPEAALKSTWVTQADAALIDLALGVGEMNGIDLGVALREKNPNIGIVIYSQYALHNMARRVPVSDSMGWSFVEKSGDMSAEALVEVIRATAQGMSRVVTADPLVDGDSGVIDQMSPRQRAIMSLAATGLAAPEIARRLGISHDAVRKDLSKTYRLLVPDEDGSDLRTKAVLAYLRLTRDPSWDG